jgi:hypothetical protein
MLTKSINEFLWKTALAKGCFCFHQSSSYSFQTVFHPSDDRLSQSQMWLRLGRAVLFVSFTYCRSASLFQRIHCGPFDRNSFFVPFHERSKASDVFRIGCDRFAFITGKNFVGEISFQGLILFLAGKIRGQ